MRRRQFIKFGLTAISGIGVAACVPGLTYNAVPQQFVYSGFDDEQGHHYLGLLNLHTQQLRSVETTFRGHDVLPHPPNPYRAILFGRRPESRCCEVDFQTLQSKEIKASLNRHFYGHGCFSADHQYLFTTENDFINARGVVGIRDAKTFQHLAECPSYGIGPHDIQLMPDGRTLVIANGGIQTHPDFGRRKLNLKTMRPSLVYIDVASGKLLAKFTLQDHLLSIRHLLVTPSGDVGVALQYQGNLYQHLPVSLVAWNKQEQSLKPLFAPTDVTKALNGYIADLAYAPKQNILLVTSPRGNLISIWDIENERHLKNIFVTEPSGVTYNPKEDLFVISNSEGQIFSLDVNTLRLSETLYRNKSIKWDNHMAPVTI